MLELIKNKIRDLKYKSEVEWKIICCPCLCCRKNLKQNLEQHEQTKKQLFLEERRLTFLEQLCAGKIATQCLALPFNPKSSFAEKQIEYAKELNIEFSYSI